MGAKAAKLSAPPEHRRTHPGFSHFIEVTPGFWNLRGDFKVMGGMVNIGTHMSVCRLSSGDFVAVDCMRLPPEAKRELDVLTGNGTRLTTVLNTHPFHTLGIPHFHAKYPSGQCGGMQRRWYGCPRHLRQCTRDADGKAIEWHGDFGVSCRLKDFEPELFLRVPDGAEFDDPKPPNTNHFSNVFVFHSASKTVHNDDCVIFIDGPGFLMRMSGYKNNTMHFHMSIMGPGLHPTEHAPGQFKAWLERLLRDWDFKHIVTAHNGNCFNEAKVLLSELLHSSAPGLEKLARRNAERTAGGCGRAADAPPKAAWSDDPDEHECG